MPNLTYRPAHQPDRSFAWFAALGSGAGRLGRFFAHPRSWRVLDATIAVVMLALAVSLLTSR